MKPKLLYGDTDSFIPLYPRAMRCSLGVGKMTSSMFLVMRQMMSQKTAALDHGQVEECRKCVEKRKGSDIACDRYVQCMIGADETSEYVKSASKLLDQLSSLFDIRKVKEG